MPSQKISEDQSIADANILSSTTLFPVVDDTEPLAANKNKKFAGDKLSTQLELSGFFKPTITSPADDQLVQRKSGVWVNRTIKQVLSDYRFVIPYVVDCPLASMTGVTTEQIMQTVTIPANTIQEDDIVSIKAFSGKIGNNAAGVHRVKFNTTDDLLGSPISVATYTNGGTTPAQAIKALREIFCISQTSQRVVGGTTGNLVTDDSAIGAQPTTLAIDFTQTQYVHFTSQLTSAADTALLVGFYIEIFRKQ